MTGPSLPLSSRPTRALTVRQPWAWAIIHGGKDVENRGWPVPKTVELPQRIAIHAAMGCTQKEWGRAAEWMRLRGLPTPPSLEHLPRGAIIGTVEVFGCSPHFPSPWVDGSGFAWLLRRTQAFARPVTCTGRLGLWEIPWSLLRRLDAVEVVR